MPSWTIYENTGINLTPFLTDSYPTMKNSFYRNGTHFVIYLANTGDGHSADICWAYSYNGINYSQGGIIYHNYGSANEFMMWYDGENTVYLYRIDWDSDGHCIQIGTIAGNDITWGAKKNIETTYRSLRGICKTSNGRLWVLFSKKTSTYNLYVAYSDDEGDTWSATTEVSTSAGNTYNSNGFCPLDSSHIYIIYECPLAPVMRGRHYDGSSFGDEQDINLDYNTWGTHPVCDGAGRVHMLVSNTAGGNYDIYHNWRSAGLTGSWQETPEIINSGNGDAYTSQLIRDNSSNKIRVYYTDTPEGTYYRLYYKVWDGSWNDAVEVGGLESDYEDTPYYYTSLRIPYSFDGYATHIAFTWQIYTDPWSYTCFAAGQYTDMVSGSGMYGISIGTPPIQYNYKDFIYTKSHPSEESDTFEIILEGNPSVAYFAKVEIYKYQYIGGIWGYLQRDYEFVGFVEKKEPRKSGTEGTTLSISGRCRKVKLWKKFTERFSDSRLSGFFGAVYPEELIKFILRCPVSDDPSASTRHKLGWGLNPENWVLTAIATEPKTITNYVRLRRTGFAWEKGYEAITGLAIGIPSGTDGFDNTQEDWTTVGDEPWINTDDGDTSYITETTVGGIHKYFTFADLGTKYELANFTSATLYIKAKNVHIAGSGGLVNLRARLRTNGSDDLAGDLGWDDTETTYSEKSIDVTSLLNTRTKINNCRLSLELCGKATGANESDIRVTYCRIVFEGYKSIYQREDDYFKIDLGASKSRLMGILIESRKSSNCYARNYMIETSPDDAVWTEVVNKTNNTARDILHSWTPAAARYIRIRISANADYNWEISQIYVYESDDANYQILDSDLTLGTIAPFGSTIDPINIPISRANSAIQSVVDVAHAGYTPWEWWINHRTGTINFGERKGDNKAGYVTYKMGKDNANYCGLFESNKRGDVRKSIQRCKVVGKGESKKQDDVTSDWKVNDIGIGLAGTFYEEIISEKQVGSKTVADVYANIHLNENAGIPYEITVIVTDDVQNTGMVDSGPDVGDDVEVIDVATGISGYYRITQLTKRYHGGSDGGEIIELTFTNRWKDFSDRWAEIRRMLRELGVGGQTIEDWFAEGANQDKLNEESIGDLWGLTANYKTTSEGSETDPTKYEYYGSGSGQEVYITKDKFEVRGRDVAGGPSAVGIYNQNTICNWSNNPRFQVEIHLLYTHSWENGDYAFFYMYDEVGLGDDFFGFKLSKSSGVYTLQAVLKDNGSGATQIVTILDDLDENVRYRLEARCNWDDKAIEFYVDGVIKAVLSLSSGVTNSPLNTMSVNLTTADPVEQSYLRFWTWKTQYKF